MEHNFKLLKNWLKTLGISDCLIDPLASDASFRRYFRIRYQQESVIWMNAEKEQHTLAPFIAISEALRNLDLKAPEIIASHLDHGWLLLTDFGDQTLLKIVTPANATNLYAHALQSLALLQSCKIIPNWHVPDFTAAFMRQELAWFQEWFLQKYLKLNWSPQTNYLLANCFDFLAQFAAMQPRVFMHRDYHSANLMLLSQHDIGILDFQDAFNGPITYDLVSLLRDCYIDWPEKFVQECVENYRQTVLPKVSAEQFLRWFDLMGLQRHLKALLTFSRKFCRDNHAGYLQYIPRTINYILSISERYPETKILHHFFQTRVLAECAE